MNGSRRAGGSGSRLGGGCADCTRAGVASARPRSFARRESACAEATGVRVGAAGAAGCGLRVPPGVSVQRVSIVPGGQHTTARDEPHAPPRRRHRRPHPAAPAAPGLCRSIREQRDVQPPCHEHLPAGSSLLGPRRGPACTARSQPRRDPGGRVGDPRPPAQGRTAIGITFTPRKSTKRPMFHVEPQPAPAADVSRGTILVAALPRLLRGSGLPYDSPLRCRLPRASGTSKKPI